MRIEKHDGSGSLDIKRCYLPFVLFDTCPTCGLEVAKDLGSDYLSYPVFGKPEEVDFYHYDEEAEVEHEWTRKVIIGLTMEEVP